MDSIMFRLVILKRLWVLILFLGVFTGIVAADVPSDLGGFTAWLMQEGRIPDDPAWEVRWRESLAYGVPEGAILPTAFRLVAEAFPSFGFGDDPVRAAECARLLLAYADEALRRGTPQARVRLAVQAEIRRVIRLSSEESQHRQSRSRTERIMMRIALGSRSSRSGFTPPGADDEPRGPTDTSRQPPQGQGNGSGIDKSLECVFLEGGSSPE